MKLISEYLDLIEKRDCLRTKRLIELFSNNSIKHLDLEIENVKNRIEEIKKELY